MHKNDPTPKPIELKRKLGDPGHHLPARAEQSAQIGQAIGTVEPPDDLPPEGAALWSEVLPVLAAYGGPREVDLFAFKNMCQEWATAERAQQVLNEQGYFTQGSTGQMVVHPARKVVLEARQSFLRHATEFGMTWIARSKLGLTEATRVAILQTMDNKLGANPRG